jgi:pyridoxine 5-phosphate synthase
VLARKILSFGAHGITVHPRPDGRHIRTEDVRALGRLVRSLPAGPGGKQEFNIEGYPSEDFLNLIDEVRPDQVTLVPDPPEALTSNAGWDLSVHKDFLMKARQRLRSTEARVSLFIDPFTFTAGNSHDLANIAPDRIELYTEKFAVDFPTARRDVTTSRYVQTSKAAVELGIGVNAGHDLNQTNLRFLITQIPAIAEVSIGHALICEALEQGLEITVKNYLRILADAENSCSQSP